MITAHQVIKRLNLAYTVVSMIPSLEFLNKFYYFLLLMEVIFLFLVCYECKMRENVVRSYKDRVIVDFSVVKLIQVINLMNIVVV